MTKNHAPSPSSTRRPLWLLTAGILVAHALVLQAMPLAQSTHTPTATPTPTEVFYARTIIATPAAVPESESAAEQRDATPARTAIHALPKLAHRPGKVRQHAAAASSTPITAAETPAAADDASSAPTTQHAALSASEPPAHLGAAKPAPTVPESLPSESSTNADDAAPVLVASASKHAPKGSTQSNHNNNHSAQEIISPSHQALTGNAAVRLPAPLRLEFEVIGQAKKFQYHANAELLWQHDEQSYQARQEIKVLFLGTRTQSSKGSITPQGLRPLQFSDQARREQAAQFDYEGQRIRFNSNSPEAPLLPGTQDRLSIFIQLGALLAAAPERYPTGTRIQIATAGGSNANPWTFRVEGPETLELPAGNFSTLKLQRLPRDGDDNDQQAELWLAPRLGYLPARIQLTQSNGDFANLRLSGHHPP